MDNTKNIENEFIAKIEDHQGILHKISFVYANYGTEKDDLYQELLLS